MAQKNITVKVQNGSIEELADLLWQSGRPTDPPVPPATEPVVLTAEECIRRWAVREFSTRLKHSRKEKAAKLASDAVPDPVEVE